MRCGQDVVRQGINRWPTSINTWETVGRSSHELVPQKPIKKGRVLRGISIFGTVG